MSAQAASRRWPGLPPAHPTDAQHLIDAQDPTQPNLRQVHLVHAELFDELAARGFAVTPGRIGENITVRGLDLLALPVGTELRTGSTAEETFFYDPAQRIPRPPAD